MTALTTDELTDMRAIADDFFPDLCTIQTPTAGVDATGSPTETFVNTYTSVTCRLDPAGAGDEAVMNLALEGRSSWWLNIPYDQAIDETYQVVHDGTIYQIKSVWDTHSYSTIRRALLVRTGIDAAYFQRVLATQTSSLVAFWPLWEQAGSVALDIAGGFRNGIYSNVTLGAEGIGDGRAAGSFNGTTSYVNIYSTLLTAAFNGAAGTLMAWAKVANAGVWTDGTQRTIARLSVDGSNQAEISRSTVNNRMNLIYRAGGTSKIVAINSLTSVDWLKFVITWDKAIDQVIGYMAGAQQGATLTGLGTWAGSLSSTQCCLGAGTTTPTLLWSGSLARVALWNVALTAAEILALGVL